ncbi:SPOR domain-containing protein [Cognatishimia sp. SS12]|nr:SPOR domain-containing protein [Cognatishimia sp. SS12]MDC0738675.1 SPOR domain-containing protein [Cognatishimia sp. SS12]
MQAGRAALLATALVAVSACEPLKDFSLRKPAEETATTNTATTTKFVERDVEAPEVFSVSEAGLWDGRPSLGGVWVAHPDVTDPERVIIRNKANGKFVIGALFRRERAIPGPRLQVSSDAAAAISMLAGQPVELEVTALRREEAPVDVPQEDSVEAADTVETETLDPILSAGAAIDAAEASAETEVAATPPAPAAPKPAAPAASGLTKPFIQIGIFSVEGNANGAAAQMRSAGMVPTVKKQTSKGKTFWRVLVGPATSKAERGDLIKKIHAAGFTDAYAVTH